MIYVDDSHETAIKYRYKGDDPELKGCYLMNPELHRYGIFRVVGEAFRPMFCMVLDRATYAHKLHFVKKVYYLYWTGFLSDWVIEKD